MMSNAIRNIFRALMLSASLVGASAATAQDAYPNKPLKLVLPFPPGGPIDMIGRPLAEHLSRALGRQVIVDYKPGANGMIGVESVARAAPDGYTIVLSTLGPLTIIPQVQKVNYDPLNDLTPVTQAASGPLVLVAKADLKANSIPELIQMDREGVKLSAGTSGTGSPNHMALELFNQMAGTKINHIPYKGEGPAITDLVGGQTDLAITTLVAAAAQIKAKRIKVIAACGEKPPLAMPDLPTIAQQGLPGYDMGSWQGVFVPAGTPKAIVARLEKELVKILNSAEMRSYLLDRGAESVGSSAEEFGAYVRREFAKYGRLARSINLKFE